MAKIGDQKLELRGPKDQYGPGFDDSLCDHDPHLQEEKLRWLAGLDGTQAITDSSNQEKRKVFGIARLRSLDVEIPGLEPCNPQYWQQRPQEAKDPYSESFIVPCVIDLAALEDILRNKEEVLSLRAADDVHLHLYNSVSAVQCDPASLEDVARENGTRYPGLDGSDVVVGIVDFGCDFRHANFRTPTGATRIRYFWDQSGEAGKTLAGYAQTPEGYSHGREFTAELINRALASGDENAYDTLGYTPPIAAHGTHVMDIAAGNGREPALFNGKAGPMPAGLSTPGVAPGAQIIFVQLKSFDGRGFIGNSCHLLEAVQYIFERADELGLPAVVNLSLSSTGGPHDGTTLIERRFEAMVRAKRGRAIVTSAGNSYSLRSHLFRKVGSGTTIDWFPDPRFRDVDKIKSEMEIWYPGNAELKVTLHAPDAHGTGMSLGDIPLGETKELYAGSQRLGRISHRKNDRNNADNQIDFRLPFLEDWPKDSRDPQPWRIEISSKDPQVPVSLHAWIEQSERGLAYFSGVTDIDRLCTLGSISCGQGTLTVGAFDTFEMASLAPPYEVTSSGPIRTTGGTGPQATAAPQGMGKPELCAPGVNIVAARSQGGVTSLSGTSMAAPHVTGLIALLFQLANLSGRGSISWEETRMILTNGLKPLVRMDFKDPADPRHDLRLGYGRINGPVAIADLLIRVMRSITIDLKLAPKTNGRPSIADFSSLFTLLQDYSKATSPGATQDSEIFARLNELTQHKDWFRLTIESLG